ncbi:hypothetical protein EPA93_39295 [Ktedonosporobacter rubrisoli]|uniref:Carbohydrate kinase n=1 Tax=Ktedonosporobacter rubrisoli TaxID=2509675 RepID=A0A4P6K2J1_KTERU|nr:FGGY-family carbohydrate kinase [Ktedonosporobacter rubrisoli]QBD81696.1 hypothetical protein EPA93_39295 [Ktedonosporobacter rubrisoli]
MYLAGIDVGTTNTKAIIVDVEAGKVCAIGSCRTITQHPTMEWSEFAAQELWQAVVDSLQQALKQCTKPERICGVSVSSMGEAGFPLDAHGNILHNAIAWYDPRTASQATWWQETLGHKAIYDITGHAIHSMFGINKLLWLRQHRPDIFKHISHWLSIEDFVLWKLSGQMATDYSLASRTMVFDQQKLTWSTSLLAHAEIPIDWLPQAYPSGTPIGTVSKSASAETGLPRHTLVVTGGHDHLCGALAAGITKPDQILDSTGTACSVMVLSKHFQPSDNLRSSGSQSYAYVLPQTYVILGGLNFAGGAFAWLVSLLYGQDGHEEAYTQALQDAACAPRGARGTTILPYFLGTGTPHRHDTALAAILGLSPSHGRGELMRALLESLGFWLRDNLEILLSYCSSASQPEIVAIGGTTRAALLMQIKAEITGCRIRVPQISEAAATGAALLAGLGKGIFHSSEEAAASIQHTEVSYEPGEEAIAIYREIYQQVYIPARDALLAQYPHSNL